MPFIRFVELAPGRRPGPIPVFQVHIFLLSPEPADSVFSAVWSLPAASSSAPVLGSDQTATRQRGCLCPLNRGNLSRCRDKRRQPVTAGRAKKEPERALNPFSLLGNANHSAAFTHPGTQSGLPLGGRIGEHSSTQ